MRSPNLIRAYPCCNRASNLFSMVRPFSNMIGARRRSFSPSLNSFKKLITSVTLSFFTSFPEIGDMVLPIRVYNNFR